MVRPEAAVSVEEEPFDRGGGRKRFALELELFELLGTIHQPGRSNAA